MNNIITRWLSAVSILVFCAAISFSALANTPELALQTYTREATSLNGEWKIIVAP